MSIQDINPDPLSELSVEEFKIAFDNFWDVLSSDKDLDKLLRKENLTLKKDIDDAIKGVKMDRYRRLFWDHHKVERPDYDP